MKPWVNTAFLKFFSTAKNSMHLFFNSRQLYISAQAKVAATVSTDTSSHNFCAHISFRRSNAYRSAVASRWRIISEGESPSSWSPGKASVYINRSMSPNVAGVMSCRVIEDIVASAMEPRSSALKTGERAASTARCAWNVSLSTMNDTSVPSVLSSRIPRCFRLRAALE
uniref:Uncharacterized protein n=1 Tax=Arundo donax TaxID=35708 RepID=A0A0A9FQV5_ARUDO